MLQHLSIHNYALIDELSIDLDKGFTTITGETGAGKSILLGALSLILGQRADTKALQDKEKKCVVEGTFQIKAYGLESFFEEHDLDYEKQTIIRREINPSGKSRSFINDTPVTLAQLKELGEQLVDIHSQHETLSLNKSAFQLNVLDAFAQQQGSVDEYRKLYKEYKKRQQDLDVLIEQEKASKKEQDYFQFLLDELVESNFSQGEQEGLEEELNTLNNSEEIKTKLSHAFQSLNGGEENILTHLGEVSNWLQQAAQYNSAAERLYERLNSSLIELKDIAAELESLEGDTVHDPNRIEIVNERLNTLYSLQQKHQVQNIEDLLRLQEELEGKLNQISSLEEQIQTLSDQQEEAVGDLRKRARKISIARQKNIPLIEESIAKTLTALSMPNAQFKIEREDTDLGESGTDQLQFLFTANKGSELQPLHKVASGGELSRLMLSIKSQMTAKMALPTIIFDEIDTGVSGDVADKVGKIMFDMGKKMQVLAITHLPQIAGKGKEHLFVYKEDRGKITHTNIKKLDREARVDELAKMLSTNQPTEAARKNAAELLSN